MTRSTQGIARYLKGWRILDDEPVSDHALIAYELAWKAGSQKQKHLYTTDWDAFRENLDWRIQGSVDDDSAETCSRLMKEAYRNSGTREALSRKPYWWNTEIADKRKTCTQLRRRTSRMLRRRDVPDEEKEVLRNEYKEERTALKRLVRTSKRELWKKACEDLEEDVWGNGYRIATGRFSNPRPVDLTQEQTSSIAQVLFPRNDDENFMIIDRDAGVEPPLFTMEELQTAADRLKSGKAPGLDGIPPEAVKIAAKMAPEWILRVINQLLHARRWTRSRQELTLAIGEELTTENMVTRMIENEATWTRIHDYIKGVMKRKEEDEREAQKRGTDERGPPANSEECLTTKPEGQGRNERSRTLLYHPKRHQPADTFELERCTGRRCRSLSLDAILSSRTLWDNHQNHLGLGH
ncbi:hypothetical protein JTB14_020032 [Gonioctena quinquepunctata]|nr:hypothetical protein JTB14_020032 [Gonioctena quinquepunctata]